MRLAKLCLASIAPLFFVYKAKKENDLTLISLKNDDLSIFLEQNAYIHVALPLEDFRRIKTCIAILRRKNGTRKKTRMRKKTRSGRIDAQEEKEVKEEREKLRPE